ncbi:hypothetical protein [Bifidobacterium santillanense]|uniref:hypothetical protein n=1 Tax=Bifidobacterium santillanense TaxID=2809028 RepID=UPI001F0B092E|nr:hypothetical protein [Bifidobacterium santillanense]
MTLNRWYLVLAGVLVVWLGVAETLAIPAYGGYAREVFSNLLSGVRRRIRRVLRDCGLARWS